MDLNDFPLSGSSDNSYEGGKSNKSESQIRINDDLELVQKPCAACQA